MSLGLLALALALSPSVPARPTVAPRPPSAQERTGSPAETAPKSAGMTLEFPSGPVRDALAALPVDVEPAAAPEGFGGASKSNERTAPGLTGGALQESTTWARWRAALIAVRANPRDARARAVLALVALEQGRYRDANEHFAHVASDRALFAALLPRFAPGVPAGTPLARGGRPQPLAAGTVLRPALPPAPTVEGERRAFHVVGLELGATRIELTLSVEHEGVQAEVRHLSGPPARVALELPRVEDYGVGAEYVDWDKQPTVGAPLVVEVKEGEEPHVLFARFEPKDPKWPTRAPDELPAAVREHGVWIVLAKDDPRRATYAALAKELALPELGIACAVAEVGTVPPGGVVVDLTLAETQQEKLAWLVSALEHFALRGDRR